MQIHTLHSIHRGINTQIHTRHSIHRGINIQIHTLHSNHRGIKVQIHTRHSIHCSINIQIHSLHSNHRGINIQIHTRQSNLKKVFIYFINSKKFFLKRSKFLKLGKASFFLKLICSSVKDGDHPLILLRSTTLKLDLYIIHLEQLRRVKSVYL